MNKTYIKLAAALIGIAACTTPALAQVGVSINLGEPGFYGQIQLGDAPRPRLIYSEPRIIEREVVVEEPMYLHVRPGYARDWKHHCREYGACGRRVYFVNDNWYNTVYVEHHRNRNGHHDGRDNNGHDGRHDGDHHNNGNGHGNGRGNGHRKHHN